MSPGGTPACVVPALPPWGVSAAETGTMFYRLMHGLVRAFFEQLLLLPCICIYRGKDVYLECLALRGVGRDFPDAPVELLHDTISEPLGEFLPGDGLQRYAEGGDVILGVGYLRVERDERLITDIEVLLPLRDGVLVVGEFLHPNFVVAHPLLPLPDEGDCAD